MLNQDPNKIQTFTSKEKPAMRMTIQFHQRQHYNALMGESWCPMHIRKDVANEPARDRKVIILCETDDEALATAQYHFFSTGENFNIIDRQINTNS